SWRSSPARIGTGSGQSFGTARGGVLRIVVREDRDCVSASRTATHAPASDGTVGSGPASLAAELIESRLAPSACCPSPPCWTPSTKAMPAPRGAAYACRRGSCALGVDVICSEHSITLTFYAEC